jgi:exonuclease III
MLTNNLKASNTYTIVMGDFNAVADYRLDRSNSLPSQNRRTEQIINIVKRKGFLDTYRECNPSIKAYTWKQSEDSTHTRIDYV